MGWRRRRLSHGGRAWGEVGSWSHLDRNSLCQARSGGVSGHGRRCCRGRPISGGGSGDPGSVADYVFMRCVLVPAGRCVAGVASGGAVMTSLQMRARRWSNAFVSRCSGWSEWSTRAAGCRGWLAGYRAGRVAARQSGVQRVTLNPPEMVRWRVCEASLAGWHSDPHEWGLFIYTDCWPVSDRQLTLMATQLFLQCGGHQEVAFTLETTLLSKKLGPCQFQLTACPALARVELVGAAVGRGVRRRR